jgi:hypothetical protein
MRSPAHTTEPPAAGPLHRAGDALPLPQDGVDPDPISLPVHLHQQAEKNGGTDLAVIELPIVGVWGGDLVV